jgi:hypothetical protein
MIIFGSWTEDEHAELLKAGHPAFFLPYFHHGGAVAQEVLVRALEIFHHQRHIFTGKSVNQLSVFDVSCLSDLLLLSLHEPIFFCLLGSIRKLPT